MNTPLDNPSTRVSVQVNGQALVRQVECRKHLIDFLREDCGLKGSHVGCEHGVCGACTVRVDGQIVRGCLVLAAQADGRHIETVETLTPSPALRALQDAFVAHNALQCGYCSPGMIMTMVRRTTDAIAPLMRARAELAPSQFAALIALCAGSGLFLSILCLFLFLSNRCPYP
jgi:aerobic-type carbon monoxide dehydrogenase small subunit (CoxS/CutS family)